MLTNLFNIPLNKKVKRLQKLQNERKKGQYKKDFQLHCHIVSSYIKSRTFFKSRSYIFHVISWNMYDLIFLIT